MNLNVAIQHPGIVAWSGLINPTSVDLDLRRYVHFAFTFYVDSDITADALFELRAAPPSTSDPCAPGIYHDVAEVLTCSAPGTTVPAAKSTITIPAGTKKGTICTATLPCKPDAFLRLFPVSGDTGRIVAVATLSGPR
jgi:hypothetical protein